MSEVNTVTCPECGSTTIDWDGKTAACYTCAHEFTPTDEELEEL